jgi:hypothetical protein
MTPERLTQLKQLVEYFHGQTPTDEQIIGYCQTQNIEAIDAGTLEDFTFQFDVDALRTEVLPEVADVIAKWPGMSEFDNQADKQAAMKQFERDILGIFESRNTRFDVLMSVVESLSTIGTMIKSAGLLATDKKVAIANRYIENRFGLDPHKVGVGSYAQECKDLAKKSAV